jgi:hypothetical protein
MTYNFTILGLGCQLHVPVALLPGLKLPLLIGEETGKDPEPVWTLWSREKSLAPRRN